VTRRRSVDEEKLDGQLYVKGREEARGWPYVPLDVRWITGVAATGRTVGFFGGLRWMLFCGRLVLRRSVKCGESWDPRPRNAARLWPAFAGLVGTVREL
jgi:hypothetical protein